MRKQNRRILIATAAVCALSAAVAGGASAVSGHVDGADRSPEVGLDGQRAHGVAGERALTTTTAGEAALDREYERSGYVRLPAGTTAPAWFDALLARSDALNRIHGLGAYARPTR